MSIICFGSLNIDYVYTVDHILKPGETLESSKREIYSGGKGLNQAIALARAKSQCKMAGKIGEDGQILIDTLRKNDVGTELIQITKGASGHTIIQVDKDGQNCILYHGGTNKSISKEFIDQVLEQSDAKDTILLQNEISNIPYLIVKAKEKGLKIAFNPSPISTELPEYPINLIDILILNEIEGFELTGKNQESEILAELYKKYPQTSFLLTLGKKGVIFYDGKSTYRHGIYDVKVIDTTAAGDTFTGYFLKLFTDNYSITDCLKYASIASSIAVNRHGASQSIPDWEEVISSNLILVDKKL